MDRYLISVPILQTHNLHIPGSYGLSDTTLEEVYLPTYPSLNHIFTYLLLNYMYRYLIGAPMLQTHI